MAANLIARYVWLVDIIRRYNRVTFQEINRLWQQSGLNDGGELSLRMFHRHRIAVEEIFGINIDSSGAPKYEYFIGNPEVLENDELRSWLIDSIAVDNLLHNNSSLRDKIIIERVPANGKRFLTLIMEAIRDSRKLRIDYHSDYSDRPNTIVVEPYCLRSFHQRWYLIGKDDVKVKIYSLDRITDCQTTDETFTTPDDFSIDDYFSHCFGIVSELNVSPQEIVLRFKPEQANYIRSLPLHNSQREIEKDTFKYLLRPSFDLIQAIMSNLDKVEVVKPADLRNRVKEIAGNIVKINS